MPLPDELMQLPVALVKRTATWLTMYDVVLYKHCPLWFLIDPDLGAVDHKAFCTRIAETYIPRTNMLV